MQREAWWTDTDEQHAWVLDVLGVDTRSPKYAPKPASSGAIQASAESIPADSPVASTGNPPAPAQAPAPAPAPAPAAAADPATAPPNWVYRQSTGELTLDGAHVATGHSGDGEGRNNSAMEGTPFVGPTPQGTYQMGQQFNSPNTGPGAIRLTPMPGTNTYGRTDLEVHGGSARHPDHDSTGCIILPPNVRSRMTGQTLTVVP